MKKLTRLDRLIWTESPLAAGQFFGHFGGENMTGLDGLNWTELPSVHISARCTHMTSVGVRQHTQDVRGCPSAHTGRPWVSASTHRMSVAVRVWPCVSVSTHMTSMAVHKYTYQHVGPWTQHADPSRGLFGSFWPTWAVCSVHTGRLWVSVSTHRTSVAVRVCPSAHTGRPWLSISTHISMLVLGHSTLTLPVDCSGDFGPRGLSVQYTQDVCGGGAPSRLLLVCVASRLKHGPSRVGRAHGQALHDDAARYGDVLGLRCVGIPGCVSSKFLFV
ncbi:hypothetical protein YC2023_108625 [Brassica napus]